MQHVLAAFRPIHVWFGVHGHLCYGGFELPRPVMYERPLAYGEHAAEFADVDQAADRAFEAAESSDGAHAFGHFVTVPDHGDVQGDGAPSERGSPCPVPQRHVDGERAGDVLRGRGRLGFADVESVVSKERPIVGEWTAVNGDI